MSVDSQQLNSQDIKIFSRLSEKINNNGNKVSADCHNNYINIILTVSGECQNK